MGQKIYAAVWLGVVVFGVAVLAYDTKEEFRLAAAAEKAPAVKTVVASAKAAR